MKLANFQIAQVDDCPCIQPGFPLPRDDSARADTRTNLARARSEGPPHDLGSTTHAPPSSTATANSPSDCSPSPRLPRCSEQQNGSPPPDRRAPHPLRSRRPPRPNPRVRASGVHRGRNRRADDHHAAQGEVREMARRRFGRVRKLPSGRYQARYPALDGADGQQMRPFRARQPPNGG